MRSYEERESEAQASPDRGSAAEPKRKGRAAATGGLPPRLRANLEALSGFAMDDVRVHRNSSAPARLDAHGFAHGPDIHLGPGQDRLLAHEAWHVVQHKQGRTRAAPHTEGSQISVDRDLEAEADRMGDAALGRELPQPSAAPLSGRLSPPLIQLKPKTTRKPKASKKLTYAQVAALVAANNKSGQTDELIIAIIYKESRFDPSDRSKSSTATGLMQMTKPAVKEVNRAYKTKYTHSQMTDAAICIAAGTAYLKLRIKWAKGDVNAGLAGYGTGPAYPLNLRKAEAELLKKPADPMDALLRTIGKP